MVAGGLSDMLVWPIFRISPVLTWMLRQQPLKQRQMINNWTQ